MSHQPIIVFHFKLIAKISMAVSAMAVLILMAMLVTISGESGSSYGAIIHERGLTRQYLVVAMVVAGLLLVAVSGIFTAVIVYYSSFRVAGPLYRFTQNFKLASGADLPPTPGLRKGDALSRQADGISAAIASLRMHHEALAAARADASLALAAGDGAAYAAAVQQLRELDAKATL